jgi:hypothetical protein
MRAPRAARRALAALLASAASVSSWVPWSSSGAGPGERSGHSLLEYNDTLFVFGGRGPPGVRLHDPRTFSTARSARSLPRWTAAAGCCDDWLCCWVVLLGPGGCRPGAARGY